MKVTIQSECTPTHAELLSDAVAELEQPFKLAVMTRMECKTGSDLNAIIGWLVKECEWRFVLKRHADDWHYTLLIGFEHEADAIKCRLSGFGLHEITN